MKAFLSDLDQDINYWKNKGDQLTLMLDINECILSRKIGSFNSKLGLR